MLAAVEAPALGLEIVHQLVETLAPVLGTQYQEKIIAADMPDKIAAGVHPVVQALCQAQQHLIASAIAVDVIERLETVDIQIANHRFALLLQQSRQALLDRHVAR